MKKIVLRMCLQALSFTEGIGMRPLGEALFGGTILYIPKSFYRNRTGDYTWRY